MCMSRPPSCAAACARSQLSPRLEVCVCRRLLAHAALCRRDQALAAAALRLAAARLGYGGSTAAYVRAFMRVRDACAWGYDVYPSGE